MSSRLVGQALEITVPEGQHVLKLMLIAIADISNPEGDNIYPSNERLAAVCCCSVSSVKQIKKYLVDGGLLAPIDATGGRKKTAHYRFNVSLLADLHTGAARFEAGEKGPVIIRPVIGQFDGNRPAIDLKPASHCPKTGQPLATEPRRELIREPDAHASARAIDRALGCALGENTRALLVELGKLMSPESLENWFIGIEVVGLNPTIIAVPSRFKLGWLEREWGGHLARAGQAAFGSRAFELRMAASEEPAKRIDFKMRAAGDAA